MRVLSMANDEIKAVLFDLGDTILNFGRVETTRAFLQGAKDSHAFLKEHGQPVGNLPWYFLRNLVRLRIKHLVSNITHRDFDSLEVTELCARISEQHPIWSTLKRRRER